MTHDIPEDVKNSDVEYCINEYVRNVEHREILRERWFHGKTLDQISADYHICATDVKKIIYGIGDKVLLRATARTIK